MGPATKGPEDQNLLLTRPDHSQADRPADRPASSATSREVHDDARKPSPENDVAERTFERIRPVFLGK